MVIRSILQLVWYDNDYTDDDLEDIRNDNANDEDIIVVMNTTAMAVMA